MAKLLARFGDCVFWLGRYLERANSLARVLDVNQAYSYDAQGGRNWPSMLKLYAEEESFAQLYRQVAPEAVIAFYTVDRRTPSSIRSCIGFARENARTVRSLISTEMWSHLNDFYAQIKNTRKVRVAPENLSSFAQFVKEGCQAQVGIAQETFYRDEAWQFFLLGQQIERADQTTRLLDVKYQQLLASAAEMGSATDVSQWQALLRAAAGFQAYRRLHPISLSPESVAHFLLFNSLFPRSLLSAVNETSTALTALKRDFGLKTGVRARSHLLSFQAALLDMTMEDVLRQGMDQMADWAQRELIAATALIGREFFGEA